MYNCAQVTRWISSDEFKEAGWLRRLGVRIHLLMCRHCSRYREQLEFLATEFRRRVNERPISDAEAAVSRLVERLTRKS